MAKVANQARVDRTAAFIAEKLTPLLDRRDYRSFVSECTENCPDNGKLTNIEGILATLMALNTVSTAIMRDIATMKFGSIWDEDEEDETFIDQVRREESRVIGSLPPA